jgi:MarR family
MDSIYSASEAARELGTNAPRLLRTVDRLGLEVRRFRRGKSVRIALSGAQLERLRDQLGVVDLPPGLSRIETQVLAALARAPRGVLSARSVARRAGISPTAAARALAELVSRDLVRHGREMTALGRAHEADVYHANVAAPAWPSLAPRLARVRPPKARPQGSRPRRVPAELRHLFWNTAPSQLDLERAGGYIARRLIQTGDLDGLAWGAEHLRGGDWRHAAGTRGLAPETRALALNLAQASPN